MRKSKAVLVVGLLLVSSLGLSSCSKATTIQTPKETIPVAPVNWAPTGYTQWDESLAYKFTTNDGSWPCEDCNFWKVTVLANQDCPGGVYAELNMLDDSDTVVDWTNDTVSYLGAGQKAILKFEHYPYDDTYKTGQVTQLECN